MTERRADWPADVLNVNFLQVFFSSSEHLKKLSSSTEMLAYRIDSMTECITCFLSGMTNKLKIYDDSEPKCTQTYELTQVPIYN